jgi:hypothetical protein
MQRLDGSVCVHVWMALSASMCVFVSVFVCVCVCVCFYTKLEDYVAIQAQSPRRKWR